MDFAAALAATATRKGPTCSVGKALENIDADKAEQIRAALADSAIQTAHLARALALMLKVKLDPQGVGRHRKGQCNCGS